MGVAKLWPEIESAKEIIILDEIPSSRLVLPNEDIDDPSISNPFNVTNIASNNQQGPTSSQKQLGFHPLRVAIDMSIWLIQAESANDQGKNPIVK
jgi:hypothetical protein